MLPLLPACPFTEPEVASAVYVLYPLPSAAPYLQHAVKYVRYYVHFNWSKTERDVDVT